MSSTTPPAGAIRTLNAAISTANAFKAGSRRPLNPRETEVLRLLSQELTFRQIAVKQHKSMSTIARQKVDAMAKLGLRSDAELFQYLNEQKL